MERPSMSRPGRGGRVARAAAGVPFVLALGARDAAALACFCMESDHGVPAGFCGGDASTLSCTDPKATHCYDEPEECNPYGFTTCVFGNGCTKATQTPELSPSAAAGFLAVAALIGYLVRRSSRPAT